MLRPASLLIVIACVLASAPVAHADVVVQPDSCVVQSNGQFRAYFTATNEDSFYVGILSFKFEAQTSDGYILDAGAVAPWVPSFVPGSSGVWFMAPPFAPHYYLRSRSGFYITVAGFPACYDASYYDRMISLAFSGEVCFTLCAPVKTEAKTWGAVKSIYRK